ncbi:hypothetical protein QFC21_005036 [Naganishia friedmannii]|uniref:Uncharacterized protein n=1 Tax=Naganishia friedmannii TaxID=89922 RepID=A0ACC2VD41_9TREE|nr:hypothetical protein QFC21_005036 [Naganishia friedmannii]
MSPVNSPMAATESKPPPGSQTLGTRVAPLWERSNVSDDRSAGKVQPSASVKIADMVHLGLLNAPLLSDRSLPSVSVTLSPRTSAVPRQLSWNALGLGLPSIRRYSSVNSATNLSTPSLMLAHKYLRDNPVIRTARRETFCLAGATKAAPVDTVPEDCATSDSGIKCSQARAPCGEPPCPTAEDINLPIRTDAFLHFMIGSGLISRRKRSKRGKGVADPYE